MISDMTGVIPDPPAMPTRWRDLRGGEIRREAAMRHHHFNRVAGLQLVADPVGKEPAPDALDGHHPVAVGGAVHSE